MIMIVFAAFMALVWSALLLAGTGYFSVGAVVLVALMIGSAMFLWLWRTCRLQTDPLRAWKARICRHLPVLCLAIGSLGLTLPPGESILGGWDPGVYIHTGFGILQQKSLQFSHPDLMGMPDDERELLARNPHTVVEPFSGMRLLPDGNVTPQFYHAYPALLAWAAGIGGIWAALAVNPLLNVFSILAFYALIMCWIGDRRWAIAGAVLLALNPSQLWQAGFSTAELLTQVLVLSAFVLLHRWAQKPETRAPEALLAGTALGLAQLTRYDTLILLAIAVPVLLWCGLSKPHRRGLLLIIAMLALGGVHAWIHQRWVAPYYRPLGPLVSLGLLACAALTCLMLALRPVIDRTIGLAACRRPLLWLLSLAWGGWMSFNWLIRPALFQRDRFCANLTVWLEPLHLDWVMPVLSGPESRAMLWLQGIFGPYGLFLALAGVLWLLWHARNPAAHALAWGGMGVTVLLTLNPFNDLFMMWVSRRYIPVVIPWLILGMVYGCKSAACLLPRFVPRCDARMQTLAGLAVLLPALLLILPSAAEVTANRDWPGLVNWYQDVQAELPRDAAVFCDRPGFASPLRFIWGYQSFELNRPTPDRLEAFDEILERRAMRDGHVYLITERDIHKDAGQRHAVRWHRLAPIPMTSSIMNHSRTRIPAGSRSRGGEFSIYVVERVQPAMTNRNSSR